MLITENLEHAFSIELKNKRHVKHIFISDEAHERVLFEGNLGKLLNMSLVEGDILELIGVNGVLRISLTRGQLQETVKAHLRSNPSSEVGSYTSTKKGGGKKMRCKASRALSLTLALTLALLPVMTAQAKKPLYGAMDLEYNTAWPGPQDVIPDWVGTITIDGEEYGMLFFAIGSGKAFDDNLKGNVHFFEEIWAIYDTEVDLTLKIPSDSAADWEYWLPDNGPEELVLWGHDKGQTNVRTSKYHMTGSAEGAFGDFMMWEDRSVYMSGVIDWYGPGEPHYAPGTFRIN